MSLAKFGKETTFFNGFKNRVAFNLGKVSYMNIFAFKNEKKDGKEQVALKFIVDGTEEMLYSNSDEETKKLENIFTTWVSMYTPEEK